MAAVHLAIRAGQANVANMLWRDVDVDGYTAGRILRYAVPFASEILHGGPTRPDLATKDGSGRTTWEKDVSPGESDITSLVVEI